MDFSQYAYIQAEQWDSLEQQLKQLADKITVNETVLDALENETSALRQSNTSCFLELNRLCEYANKERQRAISLTLNDMDDDIVIDTMPPIASKDLTNISEEKAQTTNSEPKKRTPRQEKNTSKKPNTAKKQSSQRSSKDDGNEATEQLPLPFNVEDEK